MKKSIIGHPAFRYLGLVLLTALLLIPSQSTGHAKKHEISRPRDHKSASLLDRITERGYILVGTTGDYKPFSYLNPATGAFEGIDIDMASELGKALGVEVRFVQTSWPKLTEEFKAGKFDIGMGGISISMERQKLFLYSIPYLKDGKTPITLKENASRFQTIEQIDKPGIKIIVNPGGTNEKFVREKCKNAVIIVYNDNTTIFEQIIKRNADLMITDAIEAVLQQKLHPELSAVHPDQPFTYSEKSYLLPRDMILKVFVDQWLHQSLMNGTYGKIFDKWVK